MDKEDLLKTALSEEAQTARVSPDAYERIRARVGSPGNRRWYAFALVAGMAVAIAIAVFVGISRFDRRQIVTGPGPSVAPTPTSSPTDSAQDDYFPAFWPASNFQDARSMQRDAQEWQLDPREVTRRFATEFVKWEVHEIGQPTFSNPQASVRVFPSIGEQRRIRGPEHTVKLISLEGEEHPVWFVASIESKNTSLSTPPEGSEIASPVQLSGTAAGFEATVYVRIRDDAGKVLYSSFVNAGATEPEPFTDSIEFDQPTAGAGIVMLESSGGTEGSGSDWLIRRVRFANT